MVALAIFLYCVWILPYLQIGYYFNHDSHYTYLIYDHYLTRGITVQGSYGFCIIPKYGTQRYSTALFTAIILTYATAVNIDIALWYVFPLIFMPLPFFFYSIFQDFSHNKNHSSFELIILTLFVLFTPQFIKSGHNASTGMIGIWIFFILVIELFEIMNLNKINIKNLFFPTFLYLFLCLTHVEECIYFLILLLSCIVYFSFIEIKNIKKSLINFNNPKISNKRYLNKAFLSDMIIEEYKTRNILNKTAYLSIFFTILSIIFYLTFEFFGWIYYHFGTKSYLASVYSLYVQTKIKVPFILRGTMSISLLIIGIIVLSIICFTFFLKYVLIRKIFRLIKISRFGIKIFKKFFKNFKKFIRNRLFPYLFFPSFLVLILLIDIYNITTLEESLYKSVLGLLLSYIFTVFQIYLFIRGIQYYKIENNKQNFFLLALLASSIILVYFIITGFFFLAFYILHARFLTYLLFFNLLIIQDTYFKDFMKKNNKYMKIIIFLTLILGMFSSLRTLAYG
ncbi:MAG: hypothetical protein ACTSUG_12710 [Candidatus Helarchaeota archaeon]